MWQTAFAVLALGHAALTTAQGVPTWPSQIDEIEDLMYNLRGYRSKGFASVVTPCTNSIIPGFNIAAGFLRTAFHDIAEHDASAGTGGLDASIGYEMDPVNFDIHNAGPGFDTTITYCRSFFNSKASIADCLALATYAAVSSCGGPTIPMRAGRIDASGPGPSKKLPDAADSSGSLTGRFSNMGFSPQEMIQLVACGHTLGGVHPGVNPALAGGQDSTTSPGTLAQSELAFDSTPAAFDNKIITEYLDSTTQNPLVVGPSKLDADSRVFQVDNNVTVQAMANTNVYNGICQTVLQKMLETVPSSVQLSDVIVPYGVKPGQINLQVQSDDTLLFSGEIRVRTTDVGKDNIAGVQIAYKDRSGNSCDKCTIAAQVAGDAQGFSELFTYYGFIGNIKSISSFTVTIKTKDGQSRLYNNNGKGFLVNDSAFVQSSSSSLSSNSVNVVVAVRTSQLSARADQAPSMTVTVQSPRVFNTLPKLSQIPLSVSKICGGTNFAYYSGTAQIPSLQGAKLDVSVGGQVVDGFRDLTFQSSAPPPVCNVVTSSTTTSTTSSTSSTLTSTVSTSTSTSSITTSTSTSTSLSGTSTSTTTTATSPTSTSSGSSTSSGASSTSSTLTTSSLSGSSSSTDSTTTSSITTGSSSTLTSTGSSTGTTIASTSSSTSSSDTTSSSSTLTTTGTGSSTDSGFTSSSTTSPSSTGSGSSTGIGSSSSSAGSTSASSASLSSQVSTLNPTTTTTATTFDPVLISTTTTSTQTGSNSVDPASRTTSGSGSWTYTSATTSVGSSSSLPAWTQWEIAPNPQPRTTSGGMWTGYSTTVVMSYTTYCPYATVFTQNSKTYTVTAPTTLTITDCPCTIPVTQSSGSMPTQYTGVYQPPPDAYQTANAGAAALSSIIQGLPIVAAPSGGTDGGDKNIEGLDLSIVVQIITPTITQTVAVKPSGGWIDWTQPTSAQIQQGNMSTGKPAVQPASTTASPGTGQWQTISGPSGTSTAQVGKYTGSANAIAVHGEIVVLGAAAVVGAVAMIL